MAAPALADVAPGGIFLIDMGEMVVVEPPALLDAPNIPGGTFGEMLSARDGSEAESITAAAASPSGLPLSAPPLQNRGRALIATIEMAGAPAGMGAESLPPSGSMLPPLASFAHSAPLLSGGAVPCILNAKPRPWSILLDLNDLENLKTSLFTLCPQVKTLFNNRTRFCIGSMGFACFSERGLVRVMAAAFGRQSADPAPLPGLHSLRTEIPGAVKNVWDICAKRNPVEMYDVCAEHSRGVFSARSGSCCHILFY